MPVSVVDRVRAFTETPAAPVTAADGTPGYAAKQLTTEDWARVFHSDPLDRDDVQGHAA